MTRLTPVLDSLGEATRTLSRPRSASEAGSRVELLPRPDALAGRDPADVVEELADRDPDAVAIGGVTRDEALMYAELFDQTHPEIGLILVAEPTAELWQRAARIGIREIVSPEAGPEELELVLSRAVESARRRRDLLSQTDVKQGRSGRVFTISSPKGGVGKTLVASNLAVGLASVFPDEVVLVDLDLQFGDVEYALGLSPDQTIADAAALGPAIDATMLKAFLTPHESGVLALCAPTRPDVADELTVDAVERIVELLAEQFRFVVVDTGGGMDEYALAAMDLSTDLVLIASTEIPSLQAMRKSIDALRALRLDSLDWHLILNRADAKVSLDVSGIDALLGMAPTVELPSTKRAPISLNHGTPLITTDPKSGFGKPLIRWVTALLPKEDTPPRRSRFRRDGTDTEESI